MICYTAPINIVWPIKTYRPIFCQISKYRAADSTCPGEHSYIPSIVGLTSPRHGKRKPRSQGPIARDYPAKLGNRMRAFLRLLLSAHTFYMHPWIVALQVVWHEVPSAPKRRSTASTYSGMCIDHSFLNASVNLPLSEQICARREGRFPQQSRRNRGFERCICDILQQKVDNTKSRWTCKAALGTICPK